MNAKRALCAGPRANAVLASSYIPCFRNLAWPGFCCFWCGLAKAPYAQPVEQVLEDIASSLEGLSHESAAQRLRQFGENALPQPKRESAVRRLARQFHSPLIYLLLVAAAIAFWSGAYSDAIVILAVVVVNAIVGAFQEGRAARSMEALRRLVQIQARVLRGGQECVVSARELVPGDILLVTAGDAIASDARLIEASDLEVNEAVLTGESTAVAKGIDVLPPGSLLPDRTNMLYSGTLVTRGHARAAVVATGRDAELGQIASMAAATGPSKTPLARRIDRFGHLLLAGGVAGFGLVMLVGWLRSLSSPELFLLAISQLVSVVPEGLPVAMTIALAVGMQRMAARRAIVRRLAAVETLGSTTVICSDKTGTLTRNEMTVTKIFLADGRWIEVSGAGYEPRGHFTSNKQLVHDDPLLRELLEAAALCNDAELAPPGKEQRFWQAIGDPTEAALLTVAKKAGIDLLSLRDEWPREEELPFSAEAQMMATRHAHRVFIKGAPEVVLAMCEGDRAPALQASKRMAGEALRVLAIAVVRSFPAGETLRLPVPAAHFLGLVGQSDPPREEAEAAIAACRRAGIRTLLLTGDHAETGLAIARQLRIADNESGVVDSRELSGLSDDDLRRKLRNTAVFARVQPADKLRIVDVLREQGEVVAMTGDGVNDAPALVRADVGVAMGMTGTEVARDAADIVIADDNFATIVSAVEEGRVVYQNLRKAILLLLASGVAEMTILLCALLAGFPPPLAAVQILWNNLVTEGTMTINLVMEGREGREMTIPPVSRQEPLVTASMWRRLGLMSLSISIATLGFFVMRLSLGMPFAEAQTATFTLLAVCEWFNVLNCRSETQSALRKDVFRNRWLIGGLVLTNALQVAVVYLPICNRIFHTVPLDLHEVFAIGAVGSLVLWVEETRKFFARRRTWHDNCNTGARHGLANSI